MDSSKKIKDSWLIAQYRAGHKNAMALLVKRWHLIFCRHAYRYCKDAAIAKDIAQDAWIIILSKIESLENPEKFGSWGLSIVTKKAIDWCRKNKRNSDRKQQLKILYESVDPDFENPTASPEVIGKLKEGILQLSDEHQQVLKLFYIESYGLVEISEVLKVSKGTVKSRLFYAREKLKTKLKN